MKLNELNIIFNKIEKSKNNFELFIETGTYVGETLNEIKDEFEKIISIEITEKYFNYSSSRFINNKNIELIKGDSLLELPRLCERYEDKKIIFFLDGHWSAGDTGKNHLDVPLIEELKIIYEKYNNEILLIVDDADLFDNNDPFVSWDGITEKNILNTLKDRVSNYYYMDDDRKVNKKRLIIELKAKTI